MVLIVIKMAVWEETLETSPEIQLENSWATQPQLPRDPRISTKHLKATEREARDREGKREVWRYAMEHDRTEERVRQGPGTRGQGTAQPQAGWRPTTDKSGGEGGQSPGLMAKAGTNGCRVAQTVVAWCQRWEWVVSSYNVAWATTADCEQPEHRTGGGSEAPAAVMWHWRISGTQVARAQSRARGKSNVLGARSKAWEAAVVSRQSEQGMGLLSKAHAAGLPYRGWNTCPGWRVAWLWKS